jgi:hypothetical protein
MKKERNHTKGCLITLVILIAFLIYGVFVPEEGRNPTFAEDIGLTVIALVLVVAVIAIIRAINKHS